MEPLGYVTLRLRRLSPDSRMSMDGFLFNYGCSGSAQARRCENTPILLITSNISESAACPDHIVTVLEQTMDVVFRSESGEAQSGFLHRPKREPVLEVFDESVEATENVIWQTRIDKRFEVVVFAAVQPYRGVLVVRDGENELKRENVVVSYNAPFGPDAADVDYWVERAISIVDKAKSPHQLMDEAITGVERHRKSQLRKLRSTANGAAAYILALDLYGTPETALNWLISPNAALQRKAPADVVDEDGGIETIKRLLENVAKTVYPLS